MADDKKVEVKVSHEDFGMTILAVGILILLFHGDPSISECLRVFLAHLAGLKP